MPKLPKCLTGLSNNLPNERIARDSRPPNYRSASMQSNDPSAEGFIHRGRIVYSVMYDLDGGSALIVWFDRAGNDLNRRVRHSDPQRRIVTAKPGDVILYDGQ